jgi:hypothetical protein
MNLCRHFKSRLSARKAGNPPKLRIEILELPEFQLRLLFEHLRLAWGKHTVEAAKDRERQDHVLKLEIFGILTYLNSRKLSPAVPGWIATGYGA